MRSKLFSFARVATVGGSGATLAAFSYQNAADNGTSDDRSAYTQLSSWIRRRGFFLEAKDSGSGVINDLNMKHGMKWNSNWDHRTPEGMVKPCKKDATDEEKAEYNKKVEEAKPKATRVLILVRHGQYNYEGKSDSERYLTEVGREQANLTGQRLKEVLHKHLVDKKDENGNTVKPKVTITKSTMTRATETGDIIHSHLPELEIQSCDLLREGAPCPPEPPTKPGDWDVGPEDFFVEGARIEAAFRKYFHRADPKQTEESVDVLVCHGNVIRYFICRALQVDPSAWLRMSVLNGSISMVVIRPNGRISIRQVGEAGHFPPRLLTFN